MSSIILILSFQILIICYETLKKNETDAKFVSDFWASLVEQVLFLTSFHDFGLLYLFCSILGHRCGPIYRLRRCSAGMP